MHTCVYIYMYVHTIVASWNRALHLSMTIIRLSYNGRLFRDYCTQNQSRSFWNTQILPLTGPPPDGRPSNSSSLKRRSSRPEGSPSTHLTAPISEKAEEWYNTTSTLDLIILIQSLLFMFKIVRTRETSRLQIGELSHRRYSHRWGFAPICPSALRHLAQAATKLTKPERRSILNPRQVLEIL